MHDIVTNFIGFLIALGILIFIHESGHFFAAKLFRVRVLVFSLGFGKRLFGFRRGATDYRVSIVPLGGYVRMAGDIPGERVTIAGHGAYVQSPEYPEEVPTGAPDEFLSKPKWQRFLILFAGPLMNILLAVAIITAINMVGTESLIIHPVIGEVTKGEPAARAGLQFGDRITRIDGEAINDFEDLRLAIVMHAGTPLRVEFLRKGVPHTTTLTPKRDEGDYGPIGKAGILPFVDPIVGRVTPGSPAFAAGIRPGDRIVAMNGQPIQQLTEFDDRMEKANGAPVTLDLVRGGAPPLHVTLPAVAREKSDPYRGIIPPTEIKKLPFGPALRESLQENGKMLRMAYDAIARLVRAEGSIKELSGPVNIARISGEMLRRGWMPFIALLAAISLQLGVMNLLPIPVLDGGHIMILIIEGAARRDLSVRVKERIQQLGFALIAALMIVVLYNDVIFNALRMMKKG